MGQAGSTPPTTVTDTGGTKAAEPKGIAKSCGFNPEETDIKKIQKANACVDRDIRARQERLRIKLRLQAIQDAEARILGGPPYLRRVPSPLD